MLILSLSLQRLIHALYPEEAWDEAKAGTLSPWQWGCGGGFWWSSSWWSAHPAAPVLLTSGWATAKGKLWPSGNCWVSNVTREHHREMWKTDGRVSPESEFRFTAMCFATGKDEDLNFGISCAFCSQNTARVCSV